MTISPSSHDGCLQSDSHRHNKQQLAEAKKRISLKNRLLLDANHLRERQTLALTNQLITLSNCPQSLESVDSVKMSFIIMPLRPPNTILSGRSDSLLHLMLLAALVQRLVGLPPAGCDGCSLAQCRVAN